MNCITCKTGMRHLKLDLHTCDNCGLISSDIRPDTSIYDRSYTIKYSRYEMTEIGEALQKYRNDIVMKYAMPGKLLDFGCGVGSFLKYLDLSFDAYGFDINPYSGFTDVTMLFGNYGTVTMWDSIEHVADPVALIRGLNPTWLFISTPSTDDCHVDITEWRHYMPHEHCHYFNEQSLKKLLSVCHYRHVCTEYGESILRRGGGDKNIITIVGGGYGSD